MEEANSKAAQGGLQTEAENVVQAKEEKQGSEKQVVVVVVVDAYNAYAQHEYVQFDDMVYLDIDSQAQVDDSRIYL